MNENINLCEILKDCPKGTKLYSLIHGNVEFETITDDYNYPVRIKIPNCPKYFDFTKQGFYYKWYENCSCILVPSKDQRDWSKWECPKPKKPKFDPKTLKPFDKVLVYQGSYWTPAIFTHLETGTLPYKMVYHNILCKVIPYTEETEYLIGTELEVHEYYRYWDE